MSQYCRPEAVVVGAPLTFVGPGPTAVSDLPPQPDATPRTAHTMTIATTPGLITSPQNCALSGLRAHVLVEPVDRALPRQVRRGLVVAFRRRIAIETVNGVWIDVTFVRHVRRRQRLVVRRPRRREARVERAVMHQDSSLDLGYIRIRWN